MVLSHHPFFNHLPADVLKVITRIIREVSFSDGESLFQQGSEAGSVIFILEGNVRVHALVPGGSKVELAAIGAGEVLGELGLLPGHRRSASAVASGVVRAAMMDRNDLSALCAHYHPASLHLMGKLAEITARRLKKTTEGAAHLVKGTAYRVSADSIGFQRGAHFDFRPFLSQLAFFQGFSDEARREFVALCDTYTASRGGSIRAPEDGDRDLYIVIRGAVQTCLNTPGGSLRTGVLGPGRTFGDVGWVLPGGAPLKVDAMSCCTYLRLPSGMHDGLVDPSRRLSFHFHQALLRSLQVKLDVQSRDVTRRRQILVSGARRWESDWGHATLQKSQRHAINRQEED